MGASFDAWHRIILLFFPVILYALERILTKVLSSVLVIIRFYSIVLIRPCQKHQQSGSYVASRFR
jgi:MFS superfamily sulfate permease-like transporter